jgi:hypothetical protein
VSAYTGTVQVVGSSVGLARATLGGRLGRGAKPPFEGKYPRWVEFVESLPKTATGKIRRFELR